MSFDSKQQYKIFSEASTINKGSSAFFISTNHNMWVEIFYRIYRNTVANDVLLIYVLERLKKRYREGAMNNNKCFQTFSFRDKLLFQIGFYGFIIVGAFGIFTLESAYVGIAYLVYTIVGLLFGVLYFLCSHCPHVYVYNDCLFYPPIILKKLYKFRKSPMNLTDKIGFIGLMGSFVIIPNIWIWKNLAILFFFWAFALPTLFGLLFYVCRHCQNVSCPFNQVTV